MKNPDTRLYQELRLALVFNGGVSLAVWMGGAAKEIDRFRRAFSGDAAGAAPPPALAAYRELLDVLQTVVVTDVIAGASAGGINGALLAYVVANGKSLECAGADEIRDTWQNLGSMDNLLYADGKPASVLKTDEVLFTGCADVFAKLADTPRDLSGDVSRWVRLVVTATDTHGYQISAPATSGRVYGTDHRLLMRFRHVVYPSGKSLLLSRRLRTRIAAVAGPMPEDVWPFPQPSTPSDLAGPDAAALLARAARTTSSFPIGFKPSELPLNYTTAPIAPGTGTALVTATPRMEGVLETPSGPRPLEPEATDPRAQIRRFAIDGGVWDNSPFAAVLHAIEKTPSGRDVRRVLTYLVGTREPPVDDAPIDQEPGLAQSLTKSIALPADLSFANDLIRIGDDLGQQRGRLTNVLRLLQGDSPAMGARAAPDLFRLAAALFPVYQATLRAGPNGESGATLVSDELLNPSAVLPRVSAPLADWWATPDDWGWGIQPVRNTVQEARRLLRSLLSSLTTTNGLAAVSTGTTVDQLVETRELLSQLAWALDDLAKALTNDSDAAATAKARAVCGQAMHDFATAAADLNATAVAAQQTLVGSAATADLPTLAPALRAAATLTAGGAERVIKRALALEITLNALDGRALRDAVDYSFSAIRPGLKWPDQPAGADDGGVPPRPPLAGARLNHFGGFLRASWRLHDWMWGRIDGNSGIVDLVVSIEQLRRLCEYGDPAASRVLARKLAAFSIPDAADTGSYVTSRTLAIHAYNAHDVSLIENGGPESAEARDARDGHGAFVEAWQQTLAARYAARLPDIVAGVDDDGLALIRADVRRRFRFAIAHDEIPNLIAVSNSEGGAITDATSRLDDPDGALRALTPDVLCADLRFGEKFQDACNAVANALYGFHRFGFLALLARKLAQVTRYLRSLVRGTRRVRRWVRRSLVRGTRRVQS